MKLPEMKTGLTLSVLAHLALLAWGLLSFAARPLEAKPTEALPLDIISDKQFSEMTKGIKTGAKEKPPATPVEKVGDPMKVDDPVPKVDKREVKATKDPTPPPEPEKKPDPPKEAKKEPPKVDPPKPDTPKPPDPPKEAKKEPPKPEPKPEPKPDAFKPDQIAETLKKEEQKRKAEEKKAAQQQPPKPQHQLDANKIAALLDKRDPTRQTLTGAVPNQQASLGYANGQAAQLSQSEIDALRRRLAECWNPPAGAMDGGQLKVVMRILLKQDGSLATVPQLVAASPSPFGPAMAESAKRAVMTCQPFKMLRPETYQVWKDIEITFDPREMFGGG